MDTPPPFLFPSNPAAFFGPRLGSAHPSELCPLVEQRHDDGLLAGGQGAQPSQRGSRGPQPRDPESVVYHIDLMYRPDMYVYINVWKQIHFL